MKRYRKVRFSARSTEFFERIFLDVQRKSQQTTHRSECEASAMVEESLASAYRKILVLLNFIFRYFSSAQRMRTPSPGYSRSTTTAPTHADDPITENSISNRYSSYDNRPIKPLDKDMLQTQLNQYPVDP